MTYKSLLGIGILIFPALARAVYAPIPEQEQGEALTVTVDSGAYYDTNIFGSATGAIDSMVYSISPKFAFNASVEKQTFLSASYKPTLDYFDRRPTDKTLLSHEVALRLAHAFTDVSNLDLTDGFHVDKNPESLLAGQPVNTDQSVTWNEFDGRFTTALGPKFGTVLKYRNIVYAYNDDGLAHSLNRMEHLAGLELNYKALPDVAVVGEYRHQIINYSHSSGTNDKNSDFALTGLDYSLGKKVTLSTRVGLEDRRRSGEPNNTGPYAELTCRYDYSDQSFVSGGYTYSLEETDDPSLFTDTKMNRFFINVQHALTPTIVTSASATWQPSTLQGRPGKVNVDETTTRLGVAVTYLARKNLSLSATYDYDDVSSDMSNRGQLRSRVGVNMRLYF
jgi:predicted porin